MYVCICVRALCLLNYIIYVYLCICVIMCACIYHLLHSIRHYFIITCIYNIRHCNIYIYIWLYMYMCILYIYILTQGLTYPSTSIRPSIFGSVVPATRRRTGTPAATPSRWPSMGQWHPPNSRPQRCSWRGSACCGTCGFRFWKCLKRHKKCCVDSWLTRIGWWKWEINPCWIVLWWLINRNWVR